MLVGLLSQSFLGQNFFYKKVQPEYENFRHTSLNEIFSKMGALESSGQLFLKSKRSEVGALTKQLVIKIQQSLASESPSYVSFHKTQYLFQSLLTNRENLKFISTEIEQLDRLVVQLKWLSGSRDKGWENEFQCPHNRVLIKKWIDSGLSAAFFVSDPEAAKKMMQLHLTHPIYAWRDILRINAQGQMEIKVQGAWRRALAFVQNLKTNWIEWESLDKKGERWSCSSLGFINKNSYAWQELRVCGQLTSEEHHRVKNLSAHLVSPNADGLTDCVLEIVSGWNPGKRNFFLSGLFDVFRSPQHPWIRLIDNSGKMYSVGFCVSRLITPFNVAQTVRGHLRNPDTFEGVSYLCKIVTRIAITGRQFDEIKQTVEKYQSEGMEFNYLNTNCTSFVTDILFRLGFALNTTIPSHEFFFRCFPLTVQSMTRPILMKLAKVSISVFTLFRLAFSLGISTNMQKKYSLPEAALPVPENKQRKFLGIAPGDYDFQIPRKIAEWQMRQPTTKVFLKNTAVFDQY